ncbi:hypothetical protein LTR08_005889 [Meristemomyces frigidus]|nr:hypothetical protein LTR08_005889 [Meristemomyces frigidus]
MDTQNKGKRRRAVDFGDTQANSDSGSDVPRNVKRRNLAGLAVGLVSSDSDELPLGGSRANPLEVEGDTPPTSVSGDSPEPNPRAVPEEAAAEEAVPTEAAVEESVPTEAAVEEAVPTEAAAKEAVPTEAEAREAATDEANSSEAGLSEADLSERLRKVVKHRVLSHIALPGPAFPRSTFDGWEPPLPPVGEARAIRELKAVHNALHLATPKKPEYTYLQLDDFNIYMPKQGILNRHTRELVTLDRLANRKGCTTLLLEGMLSCGDDKWYVQSVAFNTMTIEGYGDPDVVDLTGRICIQSHEGFDSEIWYQLGAPAREYQRFHKPYIWLAHFAKHFVDYLIDTKKVTLEHFRSRFHEWLMQRHERHHERHHASLLSWLAEAGGLHDFRTTVAAHVGYLWKECAGIDDNTMKLYRHPIWGEVDPVQLSAIPEQPNLTKRTVVTSFAYDCFKHMYFAECLEQRPISSAVYAQVKQRKVDLGLTPLQGVGEVGEAMDLSSADTTNMTDFLRGDVLPGDVVCIKQEAQAKWKSNTPVWYAYVQAVRTDAASDRVLDLLWLYEPVDTTLGTAYYPFKNELFLSDNCNCGNEAYIIDEVVGKVDVTWFAKDPAAVSGFCVRSKYRTVQDEGAHDFLTLKESDFRCRCEEHVPVFQECLDNYKLNDTVLVREWNAELGDDRLEPAQIIAFDYDKRRVTLRRLKRKELSARNRNQDARANELELSDETYNKPPSSIVRKCHVRFFASEDIRTKRIPTPYDRDGAGGYFYIAKEPSGTKDANSKHLPPLTESWDPTNPTRKPKLKGMGIFCGGGNFDRGLEDSGAVEFDYAVDWARHALHSYRANSIKAKCFLGSVNDYLAAAFRGSTEDFIAVVGNVQVLLAGSPCQGFTVLQGNKLSAASITNASMVAAVIAFVDFYSPDYFILENVVSMTAGSGVNKTENVFTQVLAALVALGYQVQQFNMDAWSYGSSQSRSRVFIVATAPGLEPFPMPQHTHAHSSHAGFRARSLGRAGNGLPFGMRRDDYTPFSHVSPARSCSDLPSITDSQPQICPSHPDHRTQSEESQVSRTRVAMVPVRPHGMGLVQAARAGLLTGGEPLEFVQRSCSKGPRGAPSSTTYSRVYPGHLFPTVITSLNIVDGYAGRTLHWDEHRSITVLETRRAQGFPDCEVLVGTPGQQMKIIGNSVDRKVALALGLCLRESWLGEPAAEGDGMAPTMLSPLPSADSMAPPPPSPTTNPSNNPTQHPPPPSPPPSAAATAPPPHTPTPTSSPASASASAAQSHVWVAQSRAGTLTLSPAQVAQVRSAGGGFKAIMRILAARERGE